MARMTGAVGLAVLALASAFLGCTGRALPMEGSTGKPGTPGGEPLQSACAELPPRPEVKDVRRWSEARAWDGDKPTEGSDVHIPKGRRIILDESPPPLGTIVIDGELELADRDLQLTARDIHVHGALYAGNGGQPFSHRATITLTGTGDGERGIHVMGGRLELCAQAPQTIWTRIDAHAPAGSQTLTLEGEVDWAEGDELVIAPTDFYGRGETELHTVAQVSGREITLTAPLKTGRWGVLQYVTREGMSLEPDPLFEPPAKPFPTVLDQRAEVGHVTRRILIQGADDAAWRDAGMGAHLMVMGVGAVAAVDGVALRRAGQAGKLGRYPLHLHILSYATDGTERPNGPFVLRRNSVVDSRNRCVTVHATNDALVQENVCFDVRGHAIFLEDAVERRNVLERNLVLKVRAPLPEHRLLAHDGANVFQGGPSGFWLTNPDNIVRGNVAADAQGNGFWLSFPRGALGPSANVPLRPEHLGFGVFDDNTAHSNRSPGLNFDWVTNSPEGTVTPNMYMPTSDGAPPGWTRLVRFPLRRISTWKNNESGLWNRASTPDYEEWISADNVGTFFAGASYDGRLTRTLMVAKSLNAPTPYPVPNTPPVAVASYHSTLDIDHNVMIGFELVPGQPSGVFRTDDYYTRAVDLGLRRSPANRLIHSHPGWRARVPDGQQWALAGALWDPNGYFGEAERYWTFDQPFLTAGGDCTPVPPEGNGASCTGPYYGVGGFFLNRSGDPNRPLMPIRAERQTETGEPIGVWEVGVPVPGQAFGHMRHFAARKGGRYLLEFPGLPPPTEVKLRIDNAYRDDDAFVLGVAYSGAQQPLVYLASMPDDSMATRPDSDPTTRGRRRMSPATSLEEVVSSGGDRFWQDTANARVWVKIVGGLPIVWENPDPLSNDGLYRPLTLRLHPAP